MSRVETCTRRLCQSFLDVAVQGGEPVDLPLWKLLLALQPDADDVMKDPTWHRDKWDRKALNLRRGLGEVQVGCCPQVSA